jgi:hypothetical protein
MSVAGKREAVVVGVKLAQAMIRFQIFALPLKQRTRER